MIELLLKLQKYHYYVAQLAASVLGLSIAYFVASLIPIFLSSPAIPQINEASARKPRIAAAFKNIDSFYAIISGNLIRNLPIGGSNATNGATSAENNAGSGQIFVQGMISGSPSFARAAIQVVGENEANEYKVGQSVVGFKILAIKHGKLLVERGGQRWSIGVGEKSGDTVAAATSKEQNGSEQTPGATRKQISRDRLLALTRDPAEIYKNRFSPVIQNGKILGMRMIEVKNDNFLFELGARSNDIIRRINGEPLDNNEKIMELLQSLKTVDKVVIDLERSGKIIVYEISIK